MKKQCPVCEKKYIGSGVRAYNGKGGFEKVCSVDCAVVFENLSLDKFYENLEYYKELNKKLESSNRDSDNTLKLKEEIEVLESLHGFSQEMLA